MRLHGRGFPLVDRLRWQESVAFLFGLLVCGAFWPGIAGMAVSPRWAALSILVPIWLLMMTGQKTSHTIHTQLSIISLALGLSFFVYATLSLRWTASQLDGIQEWWQLLTLAGCAFIGYRTANTPNIQSKIWTGAAIALGLSSTLALLELAGFDTFFELGFGPWAQPYTGIFFTPIAATEAAVLVFIGCFARKIYWGAIACLPQMLLTHSRGSLTALGVAIVLWMWRRNKLFSVGIAGAILIGGLAIYSSHYRASSNTDRMAIYQDTIEALTPYGYGIGSYHNEYPAHATRFDTYLERPDHAHNDILELVWN